MSEPTQPQELDCRAERLNQTHPEKTRGNVSTFHLEVQTVVPFRDVLFPLRRLPAVIIRMSLGLF